MAFFALREFFHGAASGSTSHRAGERIDAATSWIDVVRRGRRGDVEHRETPDAPCAWCEAFMAAARRRQERAMVRRPGRRSPRARPASEKPPERATGPSPG